MSWLLDADVLSQPTKKMGDSRVLAWLEVNKKDCYTSTIAVAQLAYWVRSVEGRQQSVLQVWLTNFQDSLEGRVLSFNISTAHVWAEQKKLVVQKGYSMPIEDSYIAATARRHSLTIVTGNEKDFRNCGVKVFNPFKQ